MESSEPTTTLPSTTTNEDLIPLEQDVLDEYERLAENMKKVRHAFPPPFCLYAPLSPYHSPSKADAIIVGKPPRYNGWEADFRNTRRIEAIGAEDEFGVYVIEG